MDQPLTQQQVKKMFKQGLSGLPKGDWIHEEWQDFLTMLHSDEYITLDQCQMWSDLF